MASLIEDEHLDDVLINEFKGATLRLDPASEQPSRNVSPSSATEPDNQNLTSAAVSYRYFDGKARPALRTAVSDPTTDAATPPSPDQSNNFYCGHGLSRSFYQQPPIGGQRRSSWHAESGIDGGIREFFSVRVGSLEQAVEECRHLVDPFLDGTLKGVWLLTEINHWDIEKERVVVLCECSLLIVKYDFIALRCIEYNRIELSMLEHVQIGELTYPNNSLVPRISGIAGGVVTVIRGCLLNRIQNTISNLSSNVAASDTIHPKEPEEESRFSLSAVSFEPRSRNMQGFRLTWNKGHQISFAQKWNPWSRNIPYTTFTSHPLYWYTGCENHLYDAKVLSHELKKTVETFQERPDVACVCTITTNPIIIENYVGIASLLHNVTELGFFKLRGKISF